MKRYIKEFILFGIAAVLAGVIFLIANIEEKKSDYDIIFMGDSVIGNNAGNVSVTGVMEERLGKTVFNAALGGTCMSYFSANGWESVPVGQWSMVKLAQAIYADDWTSQLAGVSYAENYREINNQVLDYFYDRVNELSKIDFAKADILILEHGTNDYNCGQKLDSGEDPFDITTYAGALRTALSLLQEKFPDLRIIIASPVYCEFTGMDMTRCNEIDFGGGILDEYVMKGKSVAEEYGVEWIDMYHDSGIWSDTIDVYTYDKLHLTNEGKLLIGNLVADYLEENPLETVE